MAATLIANARCRAVPARYITFAAAIAEAQHGLENHPTAMRALRKFVARMDIVAVATPGVDGLESSAPARKRTPQSLTALREM